MSFPEDLSRFIEQIAGRIPNVHGEEASKTSLVVPFLQLLGYDVFDPVEVQPEFSADIPARRGGPKEKVDYAVRLGGKIAMFIECKAVDVDLAGHGGQLARYFNSSQDTKIGVLTNGVRYRVFTDLAKENIMDETPWLDVDIRQADTDQVESLQLLRKADFDAGKLREHAESSASHNAVVSFLSEQLREPGDSFVRWIAHEIHYAGNLTQKAVERLTPVVKRALKDAIGDHVSIALSKMEPADEKPIIARRKPATVVSPQADQKAT